MRTLIFGLICLFPIAVFGQTDSSNEETIQNKKGIERLIRDAVELKEIALTDEQLETLQASRTQLATAMQAGRQRIKNELRLIEAPTIKDIGKHNQKHEKLTSEYFRAVDLNVREVLLPVQIERIDQLALWSTINRPPGYSSMFAIPYVNQLLEIAPKQSAQIRKKSAELQNEFEKEFAQLKDKYREKLNEELTAVQRSQLKDILGEPSTIHQKALDNF